MNRPSAGVRAIGDPRVAPVLFLSCVALCVGVYKGVLPIWAAFLAVIMARITFNCLQTMRGYKVWATDWDAMGGRPAAPPSKKKRKSNPLQDFLAGVLAILLLPWVAAQFDNPRDRLIIGVIWLVMCVATPVVGIRSLLRWRRARAPRKAQAAALQDDGVVSLLVGLPSSSPSRDDAERELPDYCAGLLSRG